MKRIFSKPRASGCSVLGCENPRRTKGFCRAHYMRWRTHGDPLAGGTGSGEVQRYFQEVVLTYEGDECLPWPYSRDEKGYAMIVREGKTRKAHRLACLTVYGPPPTPQHQAAHSCGKGHEGCCTKRHLRWATPSENEADKVTHGTSPRGAKQWSAKLCEEDVRVIRKMAGEKISHQLIASHFGVTPSLVSHIHRRVKWGWLDQAAA